MNNGLHYACYYCRTRVHRIFKLVMTLDELLDACESAAAPQLQMPKLFALIKQLKKELNYPKILEGYRSSSGEYYTNAPIKLVNIYFPYRNV